MKRIWLLGAVIAGILILGVATALAAAPHASTKSGGKTKSSKSTKSTAAKLTCASVLTLQVPAGDTDVTADELTGTEGGAAACKPLGSGAEFESYTTDDSGDVTGKWQQWFNAGSMYGTFTLTPSDNNQPPSTTTFSQASYTGTFITKSGTGAYAKATGTGTLTCATNDSVHFACKSVGKVTVPGLTIKG